MLIKYQNIKVIVKQKSQKETEIRIDELAKSLPADKLESVILSAEKPKTESCVSPG
ncbi:MAG: hypothetical protein F6K54_13905 [Okeania sp. SIO3B5]|uniref:hypothetical protein n=1 Tax=Okeania sp. SIO3B5 TaxID=2607811 RepID=UPI001400A124|nr:hypothetical protein [Okeania sp. SIO3B5]NEO54077.1 hypothetical protein [Okeania sp. SIO3B5]